MHFISTTLAALEWNKYRSPIMSPQTRRILKVPQPHVRRLWLCFPFKTQTCPALKKIKLKRSSEPPSAHCYSQDKCRQNIAATLPVCVSNAFFFYLWNEQKVVSCLKSDTFIKWPAANPKVKYAQGWDNRNGRKSTDKLQSSLWIPHSIVAFSRVNGIVH